MRMPVRLWQIDRTCDHCPEPYREWPTLRDRAHWLGVPRETKVRLVRCAAPGCRSSFWLVAGDYQDAGPYQSAA